MRTAPPVSVLCTGGPQWRWTQTVLPTLAIASLVAWIAGHRGWSMQATAVSAMSSALAIGLLAWWQAAPRRLALQWDGQQWLADGAAVHAVVMMDLPHWLLIRLHVGRGISSRWVAVSAGEAGPAWHGLRVALFAQRSTPSAGPLADFGPHV
jgi:hypothetical protein